MGIGWLWIYTHSDNPEALNKENESRAFAIYSRWRKIMRCMTYITTKFREYRHERFLRKTLLALPDHMLRDIGMFRSSGDVRIEKTGRLNRPVVAASRPEKTQKRSPSNDQGKCVVITDIDRFRKKPAMITSEPQQNVQCG